MPVSKFDAASMRRAREGAGITRAQLAELVGTDAEVIGLWEDKGVIPAPRRLKKAAEAVGLTVDDLWQPSEQASPLASLRVRAGLGQRALAQRLGVSQPLVSRFERGLVELGPELVAALAQALDVADGEVLAAANAVRPNSPSSVPQAGSRSVAKQEISRNAVVGHLVLSRRLEYEGRELVRNDALPRRAYSPQGVDIEVGEGVGEDQLRAEASRLVIASGVTTFCVHHQADILMDGEHVCSVRFQIVPRVEARKLVGDDVMGLLVPKMLSDEEGQVQPDGQWGVHPVLFVAALADDRYDWLSDQAEPYAPYTAVFRDPADGSIAWFSVERDHDRAHAGGKSTTLSELGVTRDTTLHDILSRLSERGPGG